MPGSPSLAATVALMMAGAASACPEAERFKQKRAESGQEVSTELIGDPKTLKDSELTYTGRVVKALLQNSESVPDEENTTSYPTPPPAKKSDMCRSDTCCIRRHVYNDMKKAMVEADSSIVLAGECESREENRGLQTICKQTRRWFGTYKQYGVGMADLIQMGHNAGTKLCLSGPTVRTFVGRRDRSTPAPHGNLPTQEQSADKLIALFGNKTISPVGQAARRRPESRRPCARQLARDLGHRVLRRDARPGRPGRCLPAPERCQAQQASSHQPGVAVPFRFLRPVPLAQGNASHLRPLTPLRTLTRLGDRTIAVSISGWASSESTTSTA